MSVGPSTTDMKAWAKRQMRVCSCGRKYIAPRAGNREHSGAAWYRSDRKRLDICWRCEKALTDGQRGISES